MKFSDVAIAQIISKVLQGQDYRADVLSLINTQFLEYAIGFFARIAQAKLLNTSIDEDWYKREFVINPSLPSQDIIIHAGLNRKTIDNSFGSSSRNVVLEVAPEHYDALYNAINTLAAASNDIDLILTIKLRGVSVDLNITESLIVINTLAVKRAQLRGGAWSSLGKRVEKYLMLTLCGLFSVPPQHYQLSSITSEKREVDFVLISSNGKRYFCEVKLMGKGNPESADVVIARDSHLFIADTLSQRNKIQLQERGITWIELNTPQGYQKFYDVLLQLGVPVQPFTGDVSRSVGKLLESILDV